MRTIFNFIKEAAIAIDKFWIDSGGHEITIVGKDQKFYAFYDMPNIKQCNMFGIDTPNEIEVQINRDVFLKNSELFALARKLKIENNTWQITNKYWMHNRFLGKYRISLLCQKYEECVTTQNIEVDEE